MDFEFVSCPLALGIEPKDLITKQVHVGAVLMGQLGRIEWEMIAFNLIEASQEAKKWVGVKLPERIQPKTDIAQMVEEGILSESIEDGWVYSLTPLAVTTIYRVQCEAIMRAQKRDSRTKRPFLRRLRQFLTSPAKFA